MRNYLRERLKIWSMS